MAMDKIEKDYLQEENMQSNDQGHSIANLAYKGIFAFCLDEVFYDSFVQTKNTCEPSAGDILQSLGLKKQISSLQFYTFGL